jgi:aerobic-type carbon monoxide dehydrogenase small subunit (CoxS/CutS family)
MRALCSIVCRNRVVVPAGLSTRTPVATSRCPAGHLPVAEGRAGSDEDIREFMSGNLCRCGTYPNIVAAIREVAGRGRA